MEIRVFSLKTLWFEFNDQNQVFETRDVAKLLCLVFLLDNEIFSKIMLI